MSGAHHEISHHQNGAEKLEAYKRINQWHLAQYLYMSEKMQGTREGEGTLLDNSMLLFGAGMHDGNAHNPHNLPIVVAGREKGTTRMTEPLPFESLVPFAVSPNT